jgi:tetratricopeptide (TPR) repeat protein
VRGAAARAGDRGRPRRRPAGRPLGALAEELRGADGRLDALDGGEATSQVRAVFSWSYHALSTAAARLFRLLGLHPGPDAALPAIAALADVPSPRARVLLAELVRGHLLTEHAPGRYAFHDLLRAYAAELVATYDSDDVRHTAAHRMLDHYLHTAHMADVLLTPRPNPTPSAARPAGRRPRGTVGPPAGAGLVHRRAPRASRRRGSGRHRRLRRTTWRLASALTTFLDRHGYWRALTTVHTAALNAALRQGDRAGQADAHRGLGLALDRLDRPDDARAHYLRALDLFGEARQPRRAGPHPPAPVPDVRGPGPPRAGTRPRPPQPHAPPGRRRPGRTVRRPEPHRLDPRPARRPPTQALAHCQQALDLAQETGDLNGQAHIWDSLGYIHHHLGRHPQAVDCYRQAVDLFHQTGDRHSEAACLVCLGDTHHSAGAPDAAHAAWTQALAVTGELGLPDTDPLRTDLLRRLGHPPAAENPSPGPLPARQQARPAPA